MKIRSYRTLYRFFSFLSDKTNGASFFVKYKLALGALLIGLTTVSCDKEEEPEISCYLTYIPENAQNKSELEQNTDTLIISDISND